MTLDHEQSSNIANPDPAGLSIAIATGGGSEGLAATLESLADCTIPEQLLSTAIIENGPPKGAEQIAERFKSNLKIEYIHTPEPNKSAALNHWLFSLKDNRFVFFTDDDMVFSPGILTAYLQAALGEKLGVVFGGEVKTRSDVEPAKELLPHLPSSMYGLSDNSSADNLRRMGGNFLGNNWAAFSDDVRRLGGFDARFGPGSKTRASGQESQMMKRMRAAGFDFRFVADAVAWHKVEAERYCAEFVIDRWYRAGIESGVANRIACEKNDSAKSDVSILRRRTRIQAHQAIATGARLVGRRDRYLRHAVSAAYGKGFLVGWGAGEQDGRELNLPYESCRTSTSMNDLDS